jgi:hypothetical protein
VKLEAFLGSIAYPESAISYKNNSKKLCLLTQAASVFGLYSQYSLTTHSQQRGLRAWHT